MIKIISSENIENNNYLVKGIFNNRPFKAFIYQDKKTFKVNLNGFTYTKNINQNSIEKDTSLLESKNNIKSPITGIIREILVKEGEIVVEGQDLIRIESMKLIITIKSEIAGQIIKLNIPNDMRVKAEDLILVIQ